MTRQSAASKCGDELNYVLYALYFPPRAQRGNSKVFVRLGELADQNGKVMLHSTCIVVRLYVIEGAQYMYKLNFIKNRVRNMSTIVVTYGHTHTYSTTVRGVASSVLIT